MVTTRCVRTMKQVDRWPLHVRSKTCCSSSGRTASPVSSWSSLAAASLTLASLASTLPPGSPKLLVFRPRLTINSDSRRGADGGRRSPAASPARAASTTTHTARRMAGVARTDVHALTYGAVSAYHPLPSTQLMMSMMSMMSMMMVTARPVITGRRRRTTERETLREREKQRAKREAKWESAAAEAAEAVIVVVAVVVESRELSFLRFSLSERMRQDHSDRHTFWIHASIASEWIDARARARMPAAPMQVLLVVVQSNTDRAIRFTGRPPDKADTPRLL